MKVVLALFTLMVIVPIIKVVNDSFTDVDGPIYNVTANTSINGSATTPWGASAFLFWQLLPYIIGLMVIIFIFKQISDKMRPPEDRRR